MRTAPVAAGPPRLSAVVITRNEERQLEAVLESVRWADEVIVVDSGSTDRTLEIARRYTPHVHEHDWPGYGLQRQRAYGYATGEWLLWIDADEVVSPELQRSIRAVLADPHAADYYEVELHTWFLGQWFGRRGWRHEWKRRLFRRESVRFNDEPVHEGIAVRGRGARLRGPLLHYSFRDIAHRLEKQNHYSSLMADKRYARGRRAGVVRASAGAFGTFAKFYVARGGFLHGGAGFVDAIMESYYVFLKYVKLHERAVREHRDDAVVTAPRAWSMVG